ncbi:hypothetical protein FIBSPDRAFT_509487 [Athelia psychrophila]|uniref:Uncharacterized protein n=1 Tax=Athelia psychrophila TaxID=1759441 RepID=A0A166JYA6_9AGAM|nr:hypothetical protein FIBSPDRAFT_509487 [Fibularhizoctonia sp. CBS 109695]
MLSAIPSLTTSSLASSSFLLLGVYAARMVAGRAVTSNRKHLNFKFSLCLPAVPLTTLKIGVLAKDHNSNVCLYLFCHVVSTLTFARTRRQMHTHHHTGQRPALHPCTHNPTLHMQSP